MNITDDLIPCLIPTLTAPDDIWIATDLSNISYLKVYADKNIVVKVSKGLVESIKSQSPGSLRKGFPITLYS
ncbi:MAG: hypothetical protein P9X26_06395 [Candidatus Stygibacter frigidus]|nr:hypothetical protein [Candidatus Stygibacter frigidus]